MYGAAAELELCPSRHAGLEPALKKVMFMQPMTFWTNPPELRLLVGMRPDDGVLQALVDNR